MSLSHRENAGTLVMVPLIINPIYTLYSTYCVYPVLKGSLGGSAARGPPSQGYQPFPYDYHQHPG